MSIIKQLSREVAEKIAAGEVVERPASVVKELLENSIDAGARSIIIDCIAGGRKCITVSDDGSGMDRTDLTLCVQRHATSKIESESDLWKISTMGFRGEALAAIGAVSKLSIESKPNIPSAIEGARVEINGGMVTGPVSAGVAGGTKVVVADLFFNVPARQKFLRSANIEFGHITDVVTSLSLAFPNIRFELYMEGKKRFLSMSGSQKERVVSVLGDKFAPHLIEVSEEGGVLKISGFVAMDGRSGGKDMYLFINKRLVRDRVVMHAVTSAFGEMLTRGRYPACALWLYINPAEVDVNVHPTKREVRFVNSGAVHDFVTAAVRKALRTVVSLPSNKLSSFCHSRESGNLMKTIGSPLKSCGDDNRQKLIEWRASSDLSETSDQRPATNLYPLGQLSQTYILCEDVNNGALVLIDQHAAHERLGFNTLKKNWQEGTIPRQQLLIPERVELGPKSLAYVMEHIELLSKIGFEIEPFGGSTLLVKAVPAIMGAMAVADIFDKISTELEELQSSHSAENEVDRIFAVIACHRQVRAGDRLSIEELRALVSDIERENITHCPHGRPAIVRIDQGEIEKWFKRKG